MMTAHVSGITWYLRVFIFDILFFKIVVEHDRIIDWGVPLYIQMIGIIVVFLVVVIGDLVFLGVVQARSFI